jgi:hypothetical protein
MHVNTPDSIGSAHDEISCMKKEKSLVGIERLGASVLTKPCSHPQIFETQSFCFAHTNHLSAGRQGSPSWILVAAAIALACSQHRASAQFGGTGPTGRTGNATGLNISTRPILYLEDVLPCLDERCAYLVTVNETAAGPEAQAEIEDLAGPNFVEVIASETYSGERPSFVHTVVMISVLEPRA